MCPKQGMKLVGQRLRQERQRLSLSQLQLATACGIGRTTQHFYETGVRSPDAVYLLLAAAAGVDVCFLLNGKHPATTPEHHLDWAIAESIASLAVESAEREGLSIPPRKLMTLVRVLYPSFVTDSPIDKAQLIASVRLMT